MTGIDEVVTVTLLKLDKEAIPETRNCLFDFDEAILNCQLSTLN
jgi:hypothetical protein